MSTKNLFHNGPEGPVQSPRLLLFLLLSAGVHIVAYMLLLNSGALQSLIGQSGKESVKAPIEVEMVAVPEQKQKPKKRRKSRWIPVIDLPSTVRSNAPEKKEVVRYADRTVSVTQESVPEPGIEMDTAEATEKNELSKTGAKEPSGAQSAESSGSKEKHKEKEAKAAATHKSVEGAGVKRIPTEAKVVPPHMKSSAGAKAEQVQKPSLFPSKERLAAIAKSSPSTTRRGKPGKILQLNSTALIYQKYLMNVRDRVSFYWEYPVAAARNGWQGTLTIDFIITRDGTIKDVKIDRSSSYPVLDDAAITAIKLAGPFFEFPEHFELDRLDVRYQFEYRLTSLPRPTH